MSDSRVGRVVDGRIELEEGLPELEGKTVRVTVVEVLGDADPVARAMREAPPDDRPYTDEERAAIEKAKTGPFISTAEMRRRLAAHRANQG